MYRLRDMAQGLWAEVQALGVRWPGLNLWVNLGELEQPSKPCKPQFSVLQNGHNNVSPHHAALPARWMRNARECLAGCLAHSTLQLTLGPREAAPRTYPVHSEGPKAHQGGGHTSSQAHRAVIHLEKRKPTATQTVPSLEVALGDSHQTAHSFHLELKPLQPPTAPNPHPRGSGTPRLETKTDRRKLMEKGEGLCMACVCRRRSAWV